MKSLPYREGSWFAVPLREGGYAIGVLARIALRGRIVLAYLFGPKYVAVPTLASATQLQPRDAIKCLRIGDLGLMNGEWPILGERQDWKREDWVMPSFVRRDDLSKRAWSSVYSDSDPSKLEREESMLSDIDHMERDALHGSGAVEVLMTRLLSN